MISNGNYFYSEISDLGNWRIALLLHVHICNGILSYVWSGGTEICNALEEASGGKKKTWLSMLCFVLGTFGTLDMVCHDFIATAVTVVSVHE